jgi:hypothetical protein
MTQDLNCPSCGAPLEIRNRFVRIVTCDFCDNVSIFTDAGLDPTGQTAALSKVPSVFYVDAIGKLGDEPFRCVGRVRYQYADGMWDEWFLEFDGGSEPGWLVEDEGTYKFYRREELPLEEIPGYDDCDIGMTVEVGEREVYVIEMNEAKVAGGEGQLAFPVVPGQVVWFLDGSVGDKEIITVEYTDDSAQVLVGRNIDRDTVVVEKDEYW